MQQNNYIIKTKILNEEDFNDIDTRYQKWWIYSHDDSSFVKNIGEWQKIKNRSVFVPYMCNTDLDISKFKLVNGEYTAGYGVYRRQFEIINGLLVVGNEYTGNHKKSIIHYGNI